MLTVRDKGANLMKELTNITNKLIYKVGRYIRCNIYIITIMLLVVLAHRSWFFSFDLVTSDDWWFHYVEPMNEWFSLPYAWDTQKNLGGYPTTTAPFYAFNCLFGLLALLDIPYNISERILFLWPITIVSIFGIYYLSFKLFEDHIICFFASLFYTMNTYFLTIQAVGHLTISMSYSLAPLVLIAFIDSINKFSIKSAIIVGIISSVLFSYEPRIGYIVFLILFLYTFFEICYIKTHWKLIFLPIISLSIVFLIHSHWTILYILRTYSDLNGILSPTPWISWMTILNAFTLYHPFWSGTTLDFFVIQPIPLYMFVIPLIVFSSLLIKSKEPNRIIIFFALIGLIGIFLVKQENPPAGSIYEILFFNLPGFNMFREASKFYILVALSYSVLMGVLISKLYHSIYNKSIDGSAIRVTNYLVLLVILLLILVPAKPAFTGELERTFNTTEVPHEYVLLKDYLNNQNEYFRTFWYPSKQRFGYYSSNHPIVSGIETLFGTGILSKYMPLEPTWTDLPEDKVFWNLLNILSIKYIIMPYDSNNEIYCEYDNKCQFINVVDNFEGANRINFTKNIILYENGNYMNHFFSLNYTNETALNNWLYNQYLCEMNSIDYFDPYHRDILSDNRNGIKYFDDMDKSNVQYKMINPTKYIVNINTTRSVILVFSEAYDPGWSVIINDEEIPSFPLFSLINAFELPEHGNYELTVEYLPQKYTNFGLVISLITLLFCLLYIGFK